MNGTVANSPVTLWMQGGGHDFESLYERWVEGSSLEERLTTIFEMVGKKLTSIEAASAWYKLLKSCDGRISRDLHEELTRELIRLGPENQFTTDLYTDLMLNGRTVTAPPSIVFMITSCFKYMDKAQATKQAIESFGGHAVIVVGDSSFKVAREQDGITILPVSDSYEALTQKVMEGLTWVRQKYGSVCIAKVDDDMRFKGHFDPHKLAEFAKSAQYAGQVWGGSMSDRAWHIGKTSQPTSIYTRRSRCAFAYGPMYLLGPKAVDYLVRLWVYYPGEIAGRIYEDCAVGELLSEEKIFVSSFPIHLMGGVVDLTERLVIAKSEEQAEKVFA